MNPKLKMLCELYDRSDENVNVDALFKACFLKNFMEALRLLSHKQQVKFAYLCSKSVSHLCDKEAEKYVVKCLHIIEKWLESPEENFVKELINIINGIDNFHNINFIKDTFFTIYYTSNLNRSNHAFWACCSAISKTENRKKYIYKTLGFLVKVIRDG